MKTNRRAFLGLLGLAPIAAHAVEVPKPQPPSTKIGQQWRVTDDGLELKWFTKSKVLMGLDNLWYSWTLRELGCPESIPLVCPFILISTTCYTEDGQPVFMALWETWDHYQVRRYREYFIDPSPASPSQQP